MILTEQKTKHPLYEILSTNPVYRCGTLHVLSCQPKVTVTQHFVNNSSLQCYSVLSDILVKHELCIPLERGSNVLSTGEGFICLSPPSKLKIAAFLFYLQKDNFVQCYSVRSDFHPMTNDNYVT